ncbi:hypothetical protein [Halorussus salinus]|uniref:hypothetical protein n=1 Tax=Halorussus salinus TaxID=1364935 RepID=UPI001091FBE3|nr:hypothetical protein [Halorussus salinus]
MALPAAALETPLRRSINAAFHNAIAALTLSFVGTLALLPLVTIGFALLGVVHAMRVILARGSPHTARQTVGLFIDGVRTHLVQGAGLSALIWLLVGLVGGNLLMLTGTVPFLVRLVALLSLTAALIGLCALPYIVVVTDAAESLRTGVRDGVVLAVQNLRYTILLDLVLASLLVLGVLTMVGWALIGFGFAAVLTLVGTNLLYQQAGGRSIISYSAPAE